MLFNSLEYLLFLPLIVALYYLVPFKYRWILMLIGSYYFYAAWDSRYIFLILLTTLIDYGTCYFMGMKSDKKSRKPFLYISLISNLGVLFFYKYYNFIIENIYEVFGLFDWTFNPLYHSLALPIGLSFYTFQTLSYTIDVYKGDIKPEKHLGKFALYVSYFPQLVAGPIERAGALLPQLAKKHSPKYSYFREGLILILWGYFKKIIIADRLGYYVSIVFNSPEHYLGFSSFLAAVFFSLQIYCDFSAYSDIARGSSLFFGVKLMENFRRPFLSKNTKELIGRWHISLTQWFKDYLYIPLGGNQKSTPKIFFNLFLVWSLTGLWHGASWTYVLTAQLNCLFLIIGILTLSYRRKALTTIGIDPESKPLKVIDIMITFFIGASAMVFFRSKSISDGLTILTNIFSTNPENILQSSRLYPNPLDFKIAILGIMILFLVEYLLENYGYRYLLYKKTSRFFRWCIIILLCYSLFLFEFEEESPFIYFQF